MWPKDYKRFKLTSIKHHKNKKKGNYFFTRHISKFLVFTTDYGFLVLQNETNVVFDILLFLVSGIRYNSLPQSLWHRLCSKQRQGTKVVSTKNGKV